MARQGLLLLRNLRLNNMQRTVVLAKKLLARLHFLAQEVMPFLLCILSYILDPSFDLWADITFIL